MPGGSPNPNQTVTNIQQTQLPQWYQDILSGTQGHSATDVNPATGQPYGTAGGGSPGLLPQAMSLAQSQYTPYTGQQVAGFTAPQQQAFQQVQNNVGNYQPALSGTNWDIGAANNAVSNSGNELGLANNAIANSGNVYNYVNQGLGQANIGAQRGLGTAANITNSGLGYLGAGANLAGSLGSQASGTFQGGLGAAQQGLDYTGQAAQGAYGGAGAAQPYLDAATAPAGLAAASPYLGAASGNWTQNASSYMSPYVTGANNALAQQYATNLGQFVLPQIQSQFVGLGQSSSPQQANFEANIINQQMNSLGQQQAANLNQAYQSGASTYESDAARQAQLAGTAGGLGTAQQQAELQAGLGLGGLTQQGVGSLLSAGQSAGQLGLGTGQLGLGAGQLGTTGLLGAGQATNQAGLGLGQLDTSTAMGLGQLTGSLGLQAGQQMLSAGQLADQTAQTGLAAGQLANQTGSLGLQLGQATQQMGLSDASALNAIGTQQQQLGQQSLNTAYQNFLNQQQFPYQQLGYLSNIVHGLPVNQSSVYQNTGPASNATMQPSILGQLGGAAIGASGLAGSSNAISPNAGVSLTYKKGGLVRGSKKNAHYGRPRNDNRGLGFLEAA